MKGFNLKNFAKEYLYRELEDVDDGESKNWKN